MKPFTTGCVILLAGVGLTVVFWLPLWQGGGFVGGDVYSYYFPQKTFYAERLQAGELPLWHNLTGFGYPLVGESQTGVFYPFHLLFYSTLEPNTAYNTNHLLHYVLAFTFTALYAVRFGLKLRGAVFAALVYTYAWFPSRCCVEWAIIGGAWLAAALWCAESFLQARYWRYAIGLSVALALQMLAGHFQIGFITQLTLAAYIPLRLWFSRVRCADRSDSESIDPAEPTESNRCSLRALATLSVAILIAFALSAAQLLPTWKLKQNSQRATVNKNHELEFGVIPPWYWSQAIAPWHWYAPPPLMDRNQELQTRDGVQRQTNEIEAHLYFGLAPLVLAICGLVCAIRHKDRQRLLWLILGLATFVYTAGWLLPLTRHLPGFSFFQGPGRFGVVTTFAVAMFGGWTLQDLVDSSNGRCYAFVTLAAFASLISSFLLLGDVAFVLQEFDVRIPLTLGTDDLSSFTANTVVAVLFCVSITGMLLSVRKNRFGKGILYWSFCATAVVDLWIVSRLVTTSWMINDPPINHRAESPVRQILSENSESVRLYAPGANFPNVLGVSSTPVYLTFGPAEYVDSELVMPDESDADRQIEWLQDVGVSHVLSFKQLSATEWPVELLWRGIDPLLNPTLARTEPLYLYQLNDGRPRIDWEVQESQVPATIKHFTANRIEVDIDSKQGGRIVVADLHYPGWQVTVDGETAEVVKVKGIFRGVDVPAGPHKIVWKYEPPLLYWGAIISAAAVLALAAIAHIRFWHPHWFTKKDKPQ